MQCGKVGLGLVGSHLWPRKQNLYSKFLYTPWCSKNFTLVGFQTFAGVESWTSSDVHFSMCPIKQFTMSSFFGSWPHDWAFWSITVSYTTATTTFGFSIILVEAHNLKLTKQYKWVLAQMHHRRAWAAYLIHGTFIPSPPVPFAINGGFGDFWPRGTEEKNWGQDVIFFS